MIRHFHKLWHTLDLFPVFIRLVFAAYALESNDSVSYINNV